MDYKNNEELIKRYRNGESNLKNQIIENNLLLVKKIIKNICQNCDSEEDLFQVGCLGLVYALEKYEIDCATKFGTFAYKYIYCYILNYIKEQRYPIYLPRHLQDKFYEYSKYKVQNLSKVEISERMDMSLEQLEQLINKYDKINSISYLSLNQKIYGDEKENAVGYLCKSNDNVEEEVINSINEEQLFDYLESILDEKKFNIIYMYYKNRMTQEEIAVHCGQSYRSVNYQLNRTLKKLRYDNTIRNFGRQEGII